MIVGCSVEAEASMATELVMSKFMTHSSFLPERKLLLKFEQRNLITKPSGVCARASVERALPHSPGFCVAACAAAMAMALLSSPYDSTAIAVDTPYSQSKNKTLQMGLLNGKIQSCPSDINPNCISTSSMNATYAIPWVIPPESSPTAMRKLLNAIQSTQKNPKVIKMEDTPTGQFLQVEVDGLFGRDAMEFLVKDDVVTYRSLAEKVIYIYPFTTPVSDFGAQVKRVKALEDELGWTIPDFNSEF